MKMVAKPEPRRFFYIARGRDHSLCGGVATSSGISMRNVPIWRKPGDYEWERRFGTVEKAMEYAAQNMMFGVLVVDDRGTVLAVRDEEPAEVVGCV